jgi:hypothetical protein
MFQILAAVIGAVGVAALVMSMPEAPPVLSQIPPEGHTAR